MGMGIGFVGQRGNGYGYCTCRSVVRVWSYRLRLGGFYLVILFDFYLVCFLLPFLWFFCFFFNAGLAKSRDHCGDCEGNRGCTCIFATASIAVFHGCGFDTVSDTVSYGLHLGFGLYSDSKERYWLLRITRYCSNRQPFLGMLALSLAPTW